VSDNNDDDECDIPFDEEDIKKFTPLKTKIVKNIPLKRGDGGINFCCFENRIDRSILKDKNYSEFTFLTNTKDVPDDIVYKGMLSFLQQIEPETYLSEEIVNEQFSYIGKHRKLYNVPVNLDEMYLRYNDITSFIEKLPNEKLEKLWSSFGVNISHGFWLCENDLYDTFDLFGFNNNEDELRYFDGKTVPIGIDKMIYVEDAKIHGDKKCELFIYRVMLDVCVAITQVNNMRLLSPQKCANIMYFTNNKTWRFLKDGFFK
jgi:hypothetical protein